LQTSKKGAILKTANLNTALIEGYLKLLENLSPDNKLDLISKLTLSMKTESTRNRKRFYKAFGAWDSDEKADELIKKIRQSRNFSRIAGN
jgi:hypothetical protein